MFFRVTPSLAALALGLMLALSLVACAGSVSPAASSQSTASPSVTHLAPLTSVPPVATPSAPVATASPDTGNVDRPGLPDLSVEPVGAQAIRVTLVNADAKAWRLVVTGTGSRAADSWALDVITGDVSPVITTTETTAGVAGDPVEQSTLELGDATGRVCSAGLPVCVVATTLVLPDGGNGTLVLELVRTDASVPLAVSAATAGWPSDPFVLGPWTTTDAFPWDA